ncbi:hypothetical protein ACVWYO_000243 [Sphingomonas sp. UYP23]
MKGLLRFRVLPAHVEDALVKFREAGFEPFAVQGREDGNTSIEFRGIPEGDQWALVSAFPKEYSAIIGILNGLPFGNDDASIH